MSGESRRAEPRFFQSRLVRAARTFLRIPTVHIRARRVLCRLFEVLACSASLVETCAKSLKRALVEFVDSSVVSLFVPFRDTLHTSRCSF